MTGESALPIRLAVLGDVQVFRDGHEVALPGYRPRLILAVLLAHGGRTVGVAELVEALWAENPPAGARNMLHRHIGVLRRALEPGLPFRAEGSWLSGEPGGYRLRAGPADADVAEFRALVAQAGAAQTTTAQADVWAAALSLWRGPYARGLAAPVFAAVERERAAAALAAGEAARRAGLAAKVLPLVQAVAELHPLDEALAAETMRLLAAEGRTREAAGWFRRTERVLEERLGVAAGPILTGARDELAAPGPAAGARRPAQLPSDLWLFGGRRAELAALTAAMESSRGVGVVAIDGIPGVGKSTLAVHWAHTVAHRFPDGQLFVNLRGHDPSGVPADPGDVLTGFLDALGVPPPDIRADPEDRIDQFRTVTAGRRLLIVLDNARAVEQVRPLIPAAAGCLVLVTSRSRLTGLAAREGATLLGLDLPGPADARDDLRLRLTRPGQALREDDLDRIAAFCGRLPLAVSIVAARAAGRIDEVLRELHASRDSLDAFDDDAPGGVRAVFSWSYRQLSPAAARLFRLLPVHTGPDATLPLLASLAGVPPAGAGLLLRELSRARLVSEPRPGRYTQHDLIAVYATELAQPSDDAAAAADRLLDHYTRSVQSIADRAMQSVVRVVDGSPLPGVTPSLFDDSLAALEWFRSERENLGAAVLDSYRRGGNPWRLVADAFDLHLRAARLRQWADLARPGLDAAVAAGDRLAEAHLRRLLGNVHVLEEIDRGKREYRRALALFRDLGDPAGEAAVEIKLAEAQAVIPDTPDYARAAPHYERGAALFRAVGNPRGEQIMLVGLGRCQLSLGHTADGVATLTAALDVALASGHLQRAATVLLHLGAASGRPDAADFLLAAHRLYVETGVRYWALITQLMLAESYLAAGREHDARAVWERARKAYASLSADGAAYALGRDNFARLARLDAHNWVVPPSTGSSAPVV